MKVENELIKIITLKKLKIENGKNKLKLKQFEEVKEYLFLQKNIINIQSKSLMRL